jgi:D-serine deaminase-like pyridoxal phosphate-dependent protein
VAANADYLDLLGITKPTLLLDKARVLRNIERMAAKAAAASVRLRPHCKSHQSAEIAEWLRDYGVHCITVSSVDMACYFADNGWTDVTIAFPVNVLELDRIRALAAKIELGVLVDSEAAVGVLGNALDVPVRVWIKIDTGYGRVGIPWDHHERIVSLARAVQGFRRLDFAGILAHSGHTYYENSIEGIQRVHAESNSGLLTVKKALDSAGLGECMVSIGDTPGCSVAQEFGGVDEIRPGNFVFYDLMQATLGTCTGDDIAVAVACPIVGVYEQRGQVVIYGGAAHLSDGSLLGGTGRRVFGYLSSGEGDSLGLPDYDSPVVSLSQEHGVIEVPRDGLRRMSVGDVVLILPVHSCLTCNLHGEYRTLEGGTILRMPGRSGR